MQCPVDGNHCTDCTYNKCEIAAGGSLYRKPTMNLKDTSAEAMRILREDYYAARESSHAALIWADICERDLIADGAQSNPWSKEQVERAFREGVVWADGHRNKSTPETSCTKDPNTCNVSYCSKACWGISDPDTPMTGAMLMQAYFTRYTELIDSGITFSKWESLDDSERLAWDYVANIIQRTRNAALESMTEQRNKLREELSKSGADYHRVMTMESSVQTENAKLRSQIRDLQSCITNQASTIHKMQSEQAVIHTENGQLRRDLREAIDSKAFIEQKFADGTHVPNTGTGETLHDRYVMAALTGILSSGSNVPHVAAVQDARTIANKAMSARN